MITLNSLVTSITQINGLYNSLVCNSFSLTRNGPYNSLVTSITQNRHQQHNCPPKSHTRGVNLIRVHCNLGTSSEPRLNGTTNDCGSNTDFVTSPCQSIFEWYNLLNFFFAASNRHLVQRGISLMTFWPHLADPEKDWVPDRLHLPIAAPRGLKPAHGGLVKQLDALVLGRLVR
jgi:hypothetical protein